VLLALLVWAVIHTANKSSRPPRTRGIRPVVRHVVDVHDEFDVEHEHTVPSVQTSQDNPVVTGPPESTADAPGRPETTTDTPTTNPYPTTTPNNASHI
jgi:hypothetical protein